MVEFLHYLENTTDDEAGAATSERIKRIHNRVCKVRASEEVGVKYMQAWEERYYDREEARAEGLEEGREAMLKELAEKKSSKGMTVEEIADLLEESVEVIYRLLGKNNGKNEKEL